MKYPKSVHVFGHEIEVEVQDTPIEIRHTDEANPGRIVISRLNGQYDPNELKITLVDNPEKPTMCEANFFHEIVEAIDCHGDLMLNHTQITTFASALHQMWKELPGYAEAA